MKARWAFVIAASFGFAATAHAQSYDGALLEQNKAAADAFFAHVATPAAATDGAVVYNLKDRATQSWSKTDRATLAGMIQGCTQMGGAIPIVYAGESPKYGVLFAWNCDGGRQLQTVTLVNGGAVYRVDIMPAAGQ